MQKTVHLCWKTGEKTSFSSNKHLNHKNNSAADAGYGEEAGAEEGKNNSDGEGGDSCDWRLGCLNNGRESHDCQGNVRNVIQKGADKAVFDWLTDKGER